MREQYPKTFSFEKRCLLAIRAEDLGGSAQGEDYFLYCCQDKEANLPLNKYLSDISRVYMYGDAFFFKTLELGAVGEPKFRHMEPVVKEEVLKKLLTYDLRARQM